MKIRLLYFMLVLSFYSYADESVQSDTSHPVTSSESHFSYKQTCRGLSFGTRVGINTGIIAYSNCDDLYFSNQSNDFQGYYSGIKWQCVEYARRWLEGVRGVTFGEVDAAFEIWDLTSVTSLIDHRFTYSFKSVLNGAAVPPSIGDLLIYEGMMPIFPYGHVGVIVEVNLLKGYVDVAEQNYANDEWVDSRSYSRRIRLILSDGCYTIVDDDFNPQDNKSVGGAILGWKKVHNVES